MKKVSRSISYFDKPGIDNTGDVVEIVHTRLKEAHNPEMGWSLG
jgi:hypothetical protein